MAACRSSPLRLALKPRQSTTEKLFSVRANSSSSGKVSNPQRVSLTWPEYLTIRRSKRQWQTAATIPCALLGLAGGAIYFGTRDADPLKPIMGLDPFFFYGFCTVGCLGAGAIVGPSLGTAVWRTKYRSLTQAIDVKDAEFFNRIAKNRVDVSLQSPTQPVPDYYGEKIGSLHQYRQWLRDQAKYRTKVVLPEE